MTLVEWNAGTKANGEKDSTPPYFFEGSNDKCRTRTSIIVEEMEILRRNQRGDDDRCMAIGFDSPDKVEYLYF